MYKALDKWFLSYLRRPRTPAPDGITDLILAVCDHFEPLHATDKRGALERLEVWKHAWPKLAGEFRDSNGVGLRHTFFYPIEQYDPDLLSELAVICKASGAEVEIHLHHEGDTADGLREKLLAGKERFRSHGFLGEDDGGAVRYGFIHGDWALDNSHPDGRHCGVRNELAVLRQTGCFADFTLPSMPSPTQTRIINRIYYARGTDRPKSHDNGEPVRVGGAGKSMHRPAPDELLLVQGPLGLNWLWRKWGFLPRFENGDLTAANPPTPERFRVWERLRIHVEGRPEWLFIKLHTHGGIPQNLNMLLGEPYRQFHRFLSGLCRNSGRYRLHYVTAREMVNLIHAAEAGCTGNPGQYRNFRYHPPPLATG